MPAAKKLIEVALPLDAINAASAREKSIRHGHPSTLHLWWSRKPLATTRAVIFASLVDDPDDQNANPAFVEACLQLPGDGPNVAREGDSPRMRLFDFIERLVTWEATTDETIMGKARELIRIATNGAPPPLLDPFAGGGSIPLEAQRLGLEAHASDLNPVAVMINKAMIEIPPRFADMPPVNPRDRAGLFASPHPPAPSPIKGEGENRVAMKKEGGQTVEKWDVNPKLRQAMKEVARNSRKSPTEAENRLWQAIRNKRIRGKKFRRQMPIGAFVVDFYCPSVRLVVEVDGGIHDDQQEPDRLRQELIESLGIRFLRLTNDEVMRDMPGAIAKIKQSLADSEQGDKSPSPLVGEGFGVGGESTWKGAAGLAADVRYYGEWMREQAFKRIGHLYPKHNNETVIAWLWARTVISPNPAVNAPVPLASSFVLSKKKGRECWAKPVIEGTTVRFEVTKGLPPKGQEGTMIRRQGAKCIISGEPMTFDYIKQEGKAGRLGATLLAIVTEGKRGRNYYSPCDEHVRIAESAEPAWRPVGEMEEGNQNVRGRMWGFRDFADLFTPRQLTALTTFSDLVHEARQQVYDDALKASLANDDVPLRDGGRGARAYGEAVSVYLAFAVDKTTNRSSSLCSWKINVQCPGDTFTRQALPMMWDYAESNVLAGPSGSFSSMLKNTAVGLVKADTGGATSNGGYGFQANAADIVRTSATAMSTDPPYYDNIGYADLSDYFYIWMRRCLQNVYPNAFSTVLVPKSAELIASSHRHGGKEEAERHFECGMLDTFTNFRSYVTSEYPVTVYYAFKQQDAKSLRGSKNTSIASTGWETMLTSMIKAGYRIVGTWPMRTERKNRVLAMGTNALASSIVLVCRPRPEDAPATSRRRFLDALRAELPDAIDKMKTGSIAPVDLAQATIGPGMAIYSRYSAVRAADGNALTVRAALGLINAALDEVLAEQDADLDPETRFAIGWFEQHGFKKDDFGQANVLAQAKNTAVESVALAGVVESGGGVVRLIHWKEYDPGAYDPGQDKRPTVWEGAHHLIERLNHHGEMGAAALYYSLPGDIAESARDLAYRLYHICERKGWAEDALDYNTLVSSWSEITRLAASREQSGAQTGLFDD